jgi:hypothetical protein
MSTAIPFVYNTDTQIQDTEQLGDLYTQKSIGNFQINILKYKTP